MPTLHIEAKEEDIAKIVLTSGDPKRCEYIAKKYLENIRLVNSVRGMTAYTGEYKGKEITIFPAGMGMSSMGIYSYELYKFYKVDTIIRLGTCGTLDPNIDILDILLLDASYTESNFASMYDINDQTHLAYADKSLNNIIEDTSKEHALTCKRGVGLCNEILDLYLSSEKFDAMLKRLPKDKKIIGTEMEAFALFYTANMFDKKAACLLTVVDSKYKTDIHIDSEKREKGLDNMIKIALESSLKL